MTFSSVQNLQTLALHLGASKGIETAQMSQYFHHVVAIEADPKVKLEFLQNTSGLPTSLCDSAVFSRKAQLFLGSDFSLKEKKEHLDDIAVQSLTLKQIIYDFVYAKPEFQEKELSFIRCDLGGSEEHILEDLFYFAYSNECTLLVSFYPEFWKQHSPSDFLSIFSFFTNDRMKSPEELLYDLKNQTTILFTPQKTEKFFLKKQIPVLILCYNQPTFLRNMVQQLEKYTKDIIVIDNKSTFEPLLEYYEKEFSYTLLRQKENFGHLIYRSALIRKLTGEVYLLTDPDLQFHPHLPDNFIEKLFDLSVHFQAIRVGFALKIDSDDLREGAFFYGHSIQEWEIRFWQYRLSYPKDPEMELYEGLIDTTFCLVNRRFSNLHIRVANNYTCIHIPWHKDFQKMLLPNEYEAYLVNNKSTTYWK